MERNELNTLERVILAIIVGLMVFVSGVQAFKAGERQGRRAGWDACMEQF